MKEERLLTSEEIIEVLENAEECGRYQPEQGVMLSFQSSDFKSVIWLTPINKLAFIQGNNSTGFTHIRNRHELYADQSYWKKNKPDHPSQFRRDSIPFGDYQDISDFIYSYGEKNKKKKVERFDNYIGKYKHKDGQEIEYCLVVYEDTKIIHTLYPTRKVGNISYPKNFMWIRGSVIVKQRINSGINLFDVRVPYLNKENVAVYSAKFIYDGHTEKLTVLVHKPEERKTGETHILQERKVQVAVDGDTLRRYFQYADLYLIEKYIIGLHNHLTHHSVL